ncbi:CDP-diacylglycerol--serine O-phosphatidyltransferase [Frigidibacter sp. SD6-1]|uniref:CDP-diacylglycerol--serine O-phosphatidyltransferase n=1 Tax=Frigidibacter sp. SD6-1 TaxID=3032581 RepID=UPI0024DF3F9A|nr:CDP-diacylglycerol--serine O-phosphatidyltransferase [Frigidibacter sp. SD6-1]
MQPRPRREIPLIHLLPNAMTLGAICAGVSAIRMAYSNDFEKSVALLILAALLDGLDGRIARILKSESLMGAELDSLADVVNFGVAPAVVLYFWAMDGDQTLGWIAALVYVVCCTLRLARFNVGAKEGTLDKRFFTGVPAPAGAMLALAPLFLAQAVPGLVPDPTPIAIWIALVGGLMVSRLPTPSLKMRVPARHARPLLLAVACGAAALAAYPWATLFGADILYLLSIPGALLWQRRSSH